MALFSFNIIQTSGNARVGLLSTAHGNVQTPTFMPVGTTGTIKGMMSEQVANTGAEIILGNTYHLMLRPGPERVKMLGGLHKFMNWKKSILTDSGGFQIMSLSKLRKINEDGVTFQSHIDGSRFELTPESSIEIQHLLGSDITMVLDECPQHGKGKKELEESMHLSIRWANRSKEAFTERPGHAIFGIVQGGIHRDLREESVRSLINIGFDGYAIGGLAVGEGQKAMFRTLDFTLPFLPIDPPRYLMGVGTPEDIVGGVQRGIDMFDCVLPTRSGRTGKAFTSFGDLNIRNAKHIEDPRPIDETCTCPTCKQYSRAYIHHLFRLNEMLGPILLTYHNLSYYQSLMTSLRMAILSDRLFEFAIKFKNARQSRIDQ